MDENKDFVIDTGMPVSSPVPESQPAEPQTTEPAPIVEDTPVPEESAVEPVVSEAPEPEINESPEEKSLKKENDKKRNCSNWIWRPTDAFPKFR